MSDTPGTEIARYADVAMYDAEPMERGEDGRVTPKVYLLNMTPDPLGAIAAGCMMYEGKVVRSIAQDVKDEDRRHYFAQVQKTHLQAPFELVDFHFMIEGVTRSFTHQMVRQRTAVFMQESLRFAVKDGIDEEVALPPSLAGLKDDHPWVVLWQQAVNRADDIYCALIDAGMPAEDARGLLPHNITTRLHYKTNLRNLMEHAGNRLCTQAQFEWRLVWMKIVQVIRDYGGACHCKRGPDTDGPEQDCYVHGDSSWAYHTGGGYTGIGMAWQQDVLANLFRPICYLTGKCEFRADFDRACTIRDRVDANHKMSRPSSEWHEDFGSDGRYTPPRPVIAAIHPREWLLDPAAARVTAAE